MLIGFFITACQPDKKEQGTGATAPETERGAGEEPAATAETELPTAAQLIKPGKGIGRISIGDRGEAVTEKLGRADGGDAAMGKAWSVWYSKPGADAKDTARYSTAVYTARQMGVGDEASLVKQIRVTSPFFKTQGNIRSGVALSETLAQFPQATKVSSQGSKHQKFVMYDDVEAGIAFEIDEKAVCIAINVHAPGEAVTATYMAFPSF